MPKTKKEVEKKVEAEDTYGPVIPKTKENTDTSDKDKKHYVYFLRSTKNETAHYFGYTSQTPGDRLRQHNREITGGAVATQKYGVWELVAYVSGFETEHEAKSFEWHCQHSGLHPLTGSTSDNSKPAITFRLKRALNDLIVDAGELPYGVLTLRFVFEYFSRLTPGRLKLELVSKDNCIFNKVLSYYPPVVSDVLECYRPQQAFFRKTHLDPTRSDRTERTGDEAHDDSCKGIVSRRRLLFFNGSYHTVECVRTSPAGDFTIWSGEGSSSSNIKTIFLFGAAGTLSDDTRYFNSRLSDMGGRFDSPARCWVFPPSSLVQIENWMNVVNPKNFYDNLPLTPFPNENHPLRLARPLTFGCYTFRNITEQERLSSTLSRKMGYLLDRSCGYRLVLERSGGTVSPEGMLKCRNASCPNPLTAVLYEKQHDGKLFFAASIKNAEVARVWIKKYYRALRWMENGNGFAANNRCVKCVKMGF